MAKTLKLITDAAALAKEGKSLTTSLAKFDNRIQVYLCSEIAHIEQHRNPTRLNEFLDGIRGRGARTNAMHKFIQEFANVLWDEESKKYKMKATRSKEAFDKKFQEACETHWTEFKAEAPVQQWSFDEKLKKLLAEAQKKIQKGDNNADINMDHYKALEALFAGEQVETETV